MIRFRAASILSKYAVASNGCFAKVEGSIHMARSVWAEEGNICLFSEKTRGRGKALEDCLFDRFWERARLHGAVYDSPAEGWESLDSPPFEAEDKPSRAPDSVSRGRLHPFGPKQYLLHTESGEYAVIDANRPANGV